MPEITELTAEQEAQISVYRERYANFGWSTAPADRPRAEAAVAGLYRVMKFTPPQFVWFPSPYEAGRTIKESTGNWPGLSGVDGQLEAYWVAFYMFGRYLGVDYGADTEHLLLWDELVQSCGPCFPYENYCLMTDRPAVAKRDRQERVHCDDGPALAYRDSAFALYAVHGIIVPEVVIMRPQELTVETIDEYTNPDVRRIAMERYGIKKYLDETKGEVIHADVVEGSPRALIRDKHNQLWLYAADGSTSTFFTIPVPADVTTCREAHEAICGFDETTIKQQS